MKSQQKKPSRASASAKAKQLITLPPPPKLTRAPQSPRPPLNYVPHQLIRSVCGLVDPFCEHARGAKYPDDSSVRSLPHTLEQRTTILTDGAGTAAQLYSLQYTIGPDATASARVGPLVTGWNNWSTASPITGVSSYRIVSAGLRIQCVTAPIYSSGMIHIRIWPTEVVGNLSVVDMLSYNATYSLDIPLQDAHDLCVIFPHTPARPETFYNAIDDKGLVANTETKGFYAMTIYVSGAPFSQEVLSVKHVTHFELLFDDSSTLQMLATPSPTRNPLITNAANALTSTIKPVFEDGVRAIGSYIVDRAKKSLINLAASKLGPMGQALALTNTTIVD